MLALNWKKLLVPLACLTLYTVLALLVIAWPDLRRVWLIVFGAHALLCVLIYVGLRFYRNQAKEVRISPEEMAYLKKRHGHKVKAKEVKSYQLKQTILLLGSLVLSGVPLLLASIGA